MAGGRDAVNRRDGAGARCAEGLFHRRCIGRRAEGRSTKEHAPGMFFGGAGEGNRTLVVSLEGFCSTIELHPRGVDLTG